MTRKRWRSWKTTQGLPLKCERMTACKKEQEPG